MLSTSQNYHTYSCYTKCTFAIWYLVVTRQPSVRAEFVPCDIKFSRSLLSLHELELLANTNPNGTLAMLERQKKCDIAVAVI